MDNLRFLLSLALTFVLFLMWQAWQKDYVVPVEESPVVSPPSLEKKPDVPVKPIVESSPPAEVSQLPETPSGYTLNSGARIKILTDLFNIEPPLLDSVTNMMLAVASSSLAIHSPPDFNSLKV